MKIIKTLLMVLILMLSASISYSDSIWERTSTSPYSVSKSFRVGDLITVMIVETTTAVQKAGTDTQVKDNLAANFNHTITSLGIDPSNTVKGDLDNKYKGLGSTSRTSNVTAKVTAVVTKVMSNGNLMISGEHRVEVNDEVQTIRISGVIRPKDVSLGNSVFSSQVASASVSIKGRGTVGDAEEPGFMTKFFNWLF